MTGKVKRRDRPLTNKQKRFVNEYLVDLNLTQAAKRAGYSKRTARQIGHELYGKPHIRSAIQRRLHAAEKRAERSIDRILQELTAIAYLDPREIVTWGGSTITVRESAEIPDEVAAAVKSIEQGPGGVVIRFYDKLEALEKIGKYHNIWKGAARADQVDTSQPVRVFTIRIGDRMLPPQEREAPRELEPPGRQILPADFVPPLALPESKKVEVVEAEQSDEE